ncbi:hypothetical protein NQ317_008094 [Molorchus minor]|uniref:Uncharacterized protein n=1 Tax=Molorchus minor TaxID=1323400 RepID=A0ABQ9JE19_9CUCU|nr:hypothetical protein NQ317_008094 [Molorchus minor]
MALQTDTNPKENLPFPNEYPSFTERGQILLLDEPFMIYTPERVDTDCEVVLEPTNRESSQNLRLPEIIFDGNYSCYQLENVQNNIFQNNFEYDDDFHCMNSDQVNEGLAVLKILCNNSATTTLDQPEFIDINKLTEISVSETECSKNSKEEEIVSISDDDDDVVFVGEYKEKGENNKRETEGGFQTSDKPYVKTRRTEKNDKKEPLRNKSKDLSKEHIFEEDFAFLDTSEEEENKDEKENQVPPKKTSTTNENFKQWPVNAHERPEYNTETKQIEAFDYTIREIQKKAPIRKKPRLETVPRYCARKRKPRVLEIKKAPVADLKEVVDSTTEFLLQYFKNRKEIEKLEHPVALKSVLTTEKCLEIFKYQALLYSIVNDIDEEVVLEKFKTVPRKSDDTKET